jgi:hypothetical protein
MHWYSEYKGQCVGRVLCFVSATNFNLGEICHIGDGIITDENNVKVASWVWSNGGDGDVPLITFFKKYAHLQDKYEEVKQKIISSEDETFSMKSELAKEKHQKDLQWEKIRKQIMESD